MGSPVAGSPTNGPSDIRVLTQRGYSLKRAPFFKIAQPEQP